MKSDRKRRKTGLSLRVGRRCGPRRVQDFEVRDGGHDEDPAAALRRDRRAAPENQAAGEHIEGQTNHYLQT